MILYAKLFEIKCYQKFYDAFTVRDIEFVIPSATSALLQSFSLLFKRTNEGFVILYKTDKRHLLEKLRSNIRFTFGVRPSSRHFGNFTLLDHDLRNSRYYMSNLSGQDAAESEGQGRKIKYLHNGEFLGSMNQVLQIQFGSNLSNAFSARECTITRLGETIFSGVLSPSATAGQILGDDSGLYQFTNVDTSQSTDFYYLGPAVPGMFGILDLFVGPTEGIPLSEVLETEFQFRLNTRSAHWIYYFVSPNDSVVDVVDVGSTSNQFLFSEPQIETLINGKTATSIVSLEPIDLMNQYNGEKLFANISISSSEISKKRIRLPMPDISKIKSSNINGKNRYFSEMYVYL